jgi:hypothetical protein
MLQNNNTYHFLGFLQLVPEDPPPPILALILERIFNNLYFLIIQSIQVINHPINLIIGFLDFLEQWIYNYNAFPILFLDNLWFARDRILTFFFPTSTKNSSMLNS